MRERLVASVSKLLRKGGPYVGPRGGLWADPLHTQHWTPVTAQPHDFGHVDAGEVDKRAQDLTRLSFEELTALKRRNDELREQAGKSRQGVSLELVRWGRIIAQAIEKYPAKLVATIAVQKPQEPTPVVISMEPPAPPAEPPPRPTEVVNEFNETIDKKIEQESSPQKSVKKTAKPGRLEATGDHIWGSRIDLEKLKGGITDSEQLETMNYDDAVKLVTKGNLVPAHSLDTMKALGMSPGTAHMSLALVAMIQAKPGDSTAERAAYVDEVHGVLASVLGCKTLEDFNTLLSEMVQRRRGAKKSKVTQRLPAGTSRDAINKVVQQLKQDNPGVEYKAWVLGNDTVEIVEPTMIPYDALGTRFTSFIKSGRDSKLYRDAYGEALTADGKWSYTQQDPIGDGWEYLKQRGSAKADAAKAKQAKLKEKGKTDRGWSGAKDIRGEVERVGATVAVKDADPERVKSTFGLKEVDYGQPGYMTQGDREYHTKALEGALHDFAEILGVPPTALSLKGRLGIALGARGRGRFAAHYEPGRYVINITKFAGGGSLAHEWGHALDNIIAHVYRGTEERGRYMSDAPEASAWPEELRAAYKKVHEAIHRHPDPLKARNDHNAMVDKLRKQRNELVQKNNALVADHAQLKKKVKPEHVAGQIEVREENIKRWVEELDRHEKAKTRAEGKLPDSELANRDFWIQKQAKEIKQFQAGERTRTEADEKRLTEIYDGIEALRPDINRVNDRLRAIQSIDPTVSDYRRSAAELGEYWSRPTEMWARAFESYVEEKLKRNKRSSTYLVDGTGKKYPTTDPLPSGGTIQPYPHDQERDNIFQTIDDFIGVLAKIDQFQKALRGSLPFTRFTIPVGM
jgi:hypothetical protein